jgi:hypothetical protein
MDANLMPIVGKNRKQEFLLMKNEPCSVASTALKASFSHVFSKEFPLSTGLPSRSSGAEQSTKKWSTHQGIDGESVFDRAHVSSKCEQLVTV